MYVVYVYVYVCLASTALKYVARAKKTHAVVCSAVSTCVWSPRTSEPSTGACRYWKSRGHFLTPRSTSDAQNSRHSMSKARRSTVLKGVYVHVARERLDKLTITNEIAMLAFEPYV